MEIIPSQPRKSLWPAEYTDAMAEVRKRICDRIDQKASTTDQ